MFKFSASAPLFISATKVSLLNSFILPGIDPDVQLKSGWTSLMLAASNASLELVELLINRGANVNFHKGIQFINKVVIYMYRETPLYGRPFNMDTHCFLGSAP